MVPQCGLGEGCRWQGSFSAIPGTGDVWGSSRVGQDGWVLGIVVGAGSSQVGSVLCCGHSRFSGCAAPGFAVVSQSQLGKQRQAGKSCPAFLTLSASAEPALGCCFLGRAEVPES